MSQTRDEFLLAYKPTDTAIQVLQYHFNAENTCNLLIGAQTFTYQKTSRFSMFSTVPQIVEVENTKDGAHTSETGELKFPNIETRLLFEVCLREKNLAGAAVILSGLNDSTASRALYVFKQCLANEKSILKMEIGPVQNIFGGLTGILHASDISPNQLSSLKPGM